MKVGQHCVISPQAKIADDVKIDHFCVIDAHVEIGPGTIIRSYVELRPGTKIGNGAYLDSGVRISGDAAIEHGVVLRYGVIVARGCRIGEGTYISPQTMFQNLDHHRQAIGGAHLGSDCFVGTNVTFAAGIEVAPRTVIGSKSFVARTIREPGWIHVGIPAKPRRKA